MNCKLFTARGGTNRFPVIMFWETCRTPSSRHALTSRTPVSWLKLKNKAERGLVPSGLQRSKGAGPAMHVIRQGSDSCKLHMAVILSISGVSSNGIPVTTWWLARDHMTCSWHVVSHTVTYHMISRSPDAWPPKPHTWPPKPHPGLACVHPIIIQPPISHSTLIISKGLSTCEVVP